MDSDPTFSAGSRRARVALLVAGAVVLAAAAVGVRAAIGGHDRPPGAAPGVAAAGTTVAGQDTSVTVAAGGSGGQPAPGGSTGGGASGGSGGTGNSGGAGGSGTPRATTTSSPATTPTTPPPFEIAGTSSHWDKECSQQPDGRWHFRVEFRVAIVTYGAGTVRYQGGRGAGDHRSEVRTYTVDKAAERHVTSHGVDDTVSGSSDSPTDTVVEYLHILEPNSPNGPVNNKMIASICP